MPGSSALIATGLIKFSPDDDNNLAKENKKVNCCLYLSNYLNNCLLCCFICLN